MAGEDDGDERVVKDLVGRDQFRRRGDAATGGSPSRPCRRGGQPPAEVTARPGSALRPPRWPDADLRTRSRTTGARLPRSSKRSVIASWSSSMPPRSPAIADHPPQLGGEVFAAWLIVQVTPDPQRMRDRRPPLVEPCLRASMLSDTPTIERESDIA